MANTGIRIARNAVMLVAVVAVVGATVRVVTAPDRIKERRGTARSVCEASGGKWTQAGPDETCVKAGVAKPI